MALRERLAALQGLVDPATVIKIYGAGLEEMELLYFIEKTLRELSPPKPDK